MWLWGPPSLISCEELLQRKIQVPIMTLNQEVIISWDGVSMCMISDGSLVSCATHVICHMPPALDTHFHTFL
jgi:hypothetical protein